MSETMEIETKSVKSENSEMSVDEDEIESMILESENILNKLDTVEKYFRNFSTTINPIGYIVVTPDKNISLVDVLDILQNTSDASSFGTNILAFFQNANIIPEKLSENTCKTIG